MPLFNYSEMVAALAKPGKAFIDGLTPESAHLLHMSVGVSGETGELLQPVMLSAIARQQMNIANVIEECGDIEFYLEGYRQGIEISRDAVLDRTIFRDPEPRLVCITLYDCSAAMAVCAGNLLDTTKKAAIYCKPLDIPKALDNLAMFEYYFQGFRRRANINRDETLDGNMAKLAKRYAGLTYSNDAAQKRADKPEGE